VVGVVLMGSGSFDGECSEARVRPG